MAMLRLEMGFHSRRHGDSIAQRLNYVSGQTLGDSYTGKTYRRDRDDVLYGRIFQPEPAPKDFFELQALVNAINEAEVRKDARTGRELIGSLPNELNIEDWVEITEQFIDENVLPHRLCAIVAIHDSHNPDDTSKYNPHVHIIISTRAVGAEGFSRYKNRECDKLEYLVRCREQWARLQNLAYERNGLDIRLDHRSYRKQGIDREPRKHLSREAWEMEQRGERTLLGDANRAIRERNEERDLRQREIERSKGYSRER